VIARLEALLQDLRARADSADLVARLAEVVDEARAAQLQDRILREVARSRNRELEDRVAELSLLREVAETVSAHALEADSLPAIMALLRDRLGADRATILRLHDVTGEMVLLASDGHVSSQDPADRRLDERVAAWVAAQGEPLIVPDLRGDVRFSGEKTDGAASTVALPFGSAGGLSTAVLVLTSRAAAFFRGAHARVLRIVGAQLAGALAITDLRERLAEIESDLERDEASRAAETERRAQDLRRQDEMITDLYHSLEEVQHQLEGRNDDVVRALEFSDSIVENVNVGIGVIGGDGRVLKWNRAMEAITGGQLAREDVLGKHVDELPATLRDDFALGTDLTAALTEGRCRSRTSREVELPGGRSVHVNANLIPVPSLADGPNHVVIVLEDVTANTALHVQQVKAERLAAITETMVSVNHEVNNPLAVVLGYTQMMLSRLKGNGGAPDPVRLRGDLARIEAETLRIREITAKLAALVEPVVTDYPASGEVRMIDLSRSR